MSQRRKKECNSQCFYYSLYFLSGSLYPHGS